MRVRVRGMPIMMQDIGAGMSLFKALEINIPIEDTETAVKLSFKRRGSILIFKGILCFLGSSAYEIYSFLILLRNSSTTNLSSFSMYSLMASAVSNGFLCFLAIVIRRYI